MNKNLKERIYGNQIALSERINEQEAMVNILQEDIIKFLVRLEQKLSSKKDLFLTTVHFKLIERLERIGDHISTLLFHYEKLSSYNEKLPKSCLDDYQSLNDILQKMFHSILKSLNKDSKDSIKLSKQEVARLFEEIVATGEQIRDRQINRVKEKKISPKVNAQYMEIVNHMERTGDHLFKISQKMHKLV